MRVSTACKAALIFLGAASAAVASNDYFDRPTKAYAAVSGASFGALLAYLLNPRGPNGGEPAGTPNDPISTEEVRP